MPNRRPAGARAVTLLLFAGLLALATATCLPQKAAADEPLDGQAVHRYLSDYVARHGLSGAEVAITRHGKEIYRTGVAEDGAITASTPMGVGSVSKVITSFAVLQLVDDDTIALDDPVVQHLPEFELDDPRGRAVTVRELLSHTSGIPNPVLVPPADSLRQSVAQLRDTELADEPGKSYLYSNFNYHVAARLIEVVSGEAYPEYLQRHVFAPLKMRDTSAAVITAEQPGLDDGHVTAYGAAIPLREMTSMSAGAGDVISTAADLSRWLGMLQNGGVTADGRRLLSEKLIKESYVRQPGAGSTGLGWQHTATADPPRIGKDGSLTRYSARVDLVPSSGYAVAVLVNSYTPTFKHPFQISTGVIDLTEGRSASPGVPQATIIDGVLGLITIGWLALTVLGARRAGRWSQRRRSWSRWRFALRLLPQLIMPVLAVIVFAVLPQVQGNAATVVDAFGLWPAAMVLLLVAGGCGLVLVGLRIRRRATQQPSDQPTVT